MSKGQTCRKRRNVGKWRMTDSLMFDLAGPAPVPVTGNRLKDQVCLVTGATSGIGRATALRMATEGARAVVVTGRRQELGNALVDDIRRAGADSLFVNADATKINDAAETVRLAVAQFGRLNCVFNNAGFQERRAPLADQEDAVYAQVFDTNVHALFHGSMRRKVSEVTAVEKPAAAPEPVTGRPEQRCSKPDCECGQGPGRRAEEQRRAS